MSIILMTISTIQMIASKVASTIIDVTNGRVVAQLGSRHQDENVALGTNQAVQTDRDWGFNNETYH